MKMHSVNEPGRPRGPAPGLSLLPRAAWALLVVVFFGAAGALRAQTFAPAISQIIAAEDNSTYFDHDGDLPAVIFIKNGGSVAGTISNWSLTDNPAIPRKWIFPTGPTGIIIGPGETLIVFASNKNRLTPPYATNFLLPCGSTGYLYNPQSSLVSQKVVGSEDCPACLDLITPNSTSAWLIPTANNPPSTGADWRLPAFSDASWSRGDPCLGYDSDPLMANMILYSVFDTGTVDTVNRTITDVSGPFLHTGTWPTGAAPPIGIPLATLPKIIENVGFAGPQNPSSYVQYAHHTELDPGAGNYTWSIWIRPLNTDLTSNEVILRKGMDSSTSNAGYVMVRTPTNNVSMQLLMPGFATVTATIPGGAITRDVWHHILATVTRGTTSNLTLYHNGVQRAQSAIPAGMNINTSLPMYLARAVSGGAIMYTGRMDDYATWNRALSSTDITRVFGAGNLGKRIDDPTAPNAQPPIYTPLIETNVQTAMKGVNTSLYERIPFTIASPSLVQSMTFNVHYDDGFIAYINGVEIARRNAPSGAIAWNSAAASDRPDTNALTAEDIPVPAAGISALVAGTNILAIHALNFTASDQRFLICPDLCYDELTPEDCVVSTNGRLFWITFPGNAPEEIGNPLQLSVCITGAAGTSGNVSIPGITPPFSQNFTLPAGGKIEVVLPKAASLEKSDTIESKGVRIVATANVAVVGKTRIDYSTDTFLAHPIKCLGSSYLALCWQNSWIGLPDLNGSQFGIVATADNTHVTIKPKVTTGSHTAGVAYNFILNAGQTYMLRNLNSSPADLTGSEITSDSPIAVFGGHKCANVSGTLFFQDTLLEQTLPVALWNTESVIAPLATRTAQELVRVIAGENSTIISINGVAQPGTLNKGDKKDYPVTGGAVFSSTKKFLATHYSRSSDADGVVNADPFQLNCQPTASWLGGYRFCTPPAAEFGGFYANILARNAEIAGVTVNPAPVVTGPVVAIPGTPYSYRLVTLAAGTTYTSSGRTHGLEIYGWAEYDSYGHSGGMSFVDTQPPTLTQAPGEITLFTTFVAGAGDRATMPDLRVLFGVHDNCCPDQSLVVVQNPTAGTLLAVGDYGAVITVRDCGDNSLIYEFVVHVRTDPRATAFPAQFGNPALEATVWGWHANPDGDYFNNEQEYALGTDMAVNAPDGGAFTFSVVTYQGQEGVEVSYRRRNDDPSLEYIPEGSGDLGGWFSGLGHFEQTSATPDSLPGFTRIRAFSHDSTAFPRFFLRLNIRRN
jgi:hypothetical protein